MVYIPSDGSTGYGLCQRKLVGRRALSGHQVSGEHPVPHGRSAALAARALPHVGHSSWYVVFLRRFPCWRCHQPAARCSGAGPLGWVMTRTTHDRRCSASVACVVAGPVARAVRSGWRGVWSLVRGARCVRGCDGSFHRSRGDAAFCRGWKATQRFHDVKALGAGQGFEAIALRARTSPNGRSGCAIAEARRNAVKRVVGSDESRRQTLPQVSLVVPPDPELGHEVQDQATEHAQGGQDARVGVTRPRRPC